MRGQVRRAGGLQDVGEGMGPHRLQRVARARTGITVVDGQQRAAVADDAGGQRRHDRVARRLHLDDGAGRRSHGRRVGRKRARPEPEGEAAVGIKPDHPLAPALPGAHELADRQRVEELVRDDEKGAGGNVLDAVVPGDGAGGVGQAGALFQPQDGAGFHQIDPQRGQEGRPEGGDPQDVGHQRAASGTQLHEPHRIGGAGRVPHRQQPGAYEFAEDLGDVRRRDEIASGAERNPRGVVAVVRVAQAARHVVGDGDRPGFGDLRGEPGGERRGHRAVPDASPPAAGRDSARRMAQAPTRIIGIDSAMPMVRPPGRKPIWASGMRNCSPTMRATP